MDSNFNNLRKQFDEQPESIPEALNWENMEAGIDSKMEDLKSKSRTSSKKRTFFYLSLLGLILLIPFVCTQYSGDSTIPLAQEVVNDSKSGFEKSVESSHSDTQNSNSSQPSKKDSNTATKESSVDNLISAESISEHSNSPKVNTTQNQNNEEKVVTYEKREYDLNKNTTNDNSTDPKTVDRPLVELMNEIVSKKTDTSVSKEDENKDLPLGSIANNKNQYAFSSLASIASIKTGLFQITNRSIEIPMLFNEFKNKSISQPMSNQISILSGVNRWNMGYGSALPEREAFETNLISFSTQINYKHTLKNNYIIMTGLHFQRLESRFNWTETIDNFPVLLTDVVVEVQSNLISGSSTEIRGDVTLEVEANRVVQHYNSIQFIQLPFAFGKSWNIGNFSLDMYIGSSLNIIGSNSGKTLFGGEVIEYTNNDNPIYSYRWNLNGLIGTRLSLPINNKLGIATGFQWQRSFTDWSKVRTVKINPQIMNWEFGFVYSL